MTKLFISHASEDKADFVEPLVEALRSVGFEVWYDKYELTIGDSLLQKISQGLRECDYGVVVLSPDFFRKRWTQAELDGLFAIESTERKVILPIWRDVSVNDVTAFSPILAGRLGALTTGGIEYVVAEIRRAVESADRVASFSSVENALSIFKALDKEVMGFKRADELARSEEGVRIVDAATKEMITWLRNQVERLSSESEILWIRADAPSDHQLSFAAKYAMRFVLRYENEIINSITMAVMHLMIYQVLDPYGEDYSKRNDIRREDFEPRFHHTGKLIWKTTNTNHEFTTEQLQIRVLEEIVSAIRQLSEQAMAKKAR
jgi:hypothetical protein